MTATVSHYDVQQRFAVGHEPTVTAIAIFLNAERFLAEAIESVLHQTFSDWELLLVDDGSTDRSSEIARAFVNRYPEKMCYLEHSHHENLGMSASRNLGLEHARGDFIAFIDADDVWLPEKLEEQLGILDSHPEAAIVYGATQHWYSWTGRAEDAGRDFVPQLGVTPDTVVTPPKLASVLLQNQVVTSTGCLARREAIKQVGGYEENFRGMFEDQVFFSKVSLKLPVFVSSRCWYRYRRHSDSCCAVAEASGQDNTERLTFLEWLESYSSKQGIGDPRLRETIREERWKSQHPVLSAVRDGIRYRARIAKQTLKSIARRSMPRGLYSWLGSHRRGTEPAIPPIGQVRFGDLRRLTPLSRVFGFDRGTPIDRYYIESFLARNAADIRGRALEVGDDSYTRQFGGERVIQSDVLHVSDQNPRATIIADLADAHHIPSDTFDCIVLTQTLHLIYDVRSAIATLHRILKPGGVLLTTVPGISQIDHYDWGNSWYWAFTSHSARRLFEEAFSSRNLTIECYGNVLAATAFLQGMAVEELKQNELDHNDRDYQVIITVRATKAEEV